MGGQKGPSVSVEVPTSNSLELVYQRKQLETQFHDLHDIVTTFSTRQAEFKQTMANLQATVTSVADTQIWQTDFQNFQWYILEEFRLLCLTVSSTSSTMVSQPSHISHSSLSCPLKIGMFQNGSGQTMLRFSPPPSSVLPGHSSTHIFTLICTNFLTEPQLSAFIPSLSTHKCLFPLLPNPPLYQPLMLPTPHFVIPPRSSSHYQFQSPLGLPPMKFELPVLR